MSRSPETNLQAEVDRALSVAGVRVFRNNVGQAKTQDGRFIKYGVGGNGGSDLIGWTSVTITADMVNTVVGVFTAIEVKTPTGRVSPEQQHFVDTVNASGGRAGIARSPEEAIRIAIGNPTA
jgi:hypothetical protein